MAQAKSKDESKLLSEKEASFHGTRKMDYDITKPEAPEKYGITDEARNKIAEGGGKGESIGQYMANKKSDAGKSPTTMAKSSYALKALGAGQPFGCTQKSTY